MDPSLSPTDISPPFAVPLLPAPPSRRLPPPCWSPDETSALIHSYRHVWYSLARTNLKAYHWQQVALSVSSACPSVNPPKTALQCRHKMEKLRKRYRAEILRARNIPVRKFNSSWQHFSLMDSMEKGTNYSNSNNDNDNGNGNDNVDDIDGEDRDLIHGNSMYKLRRNGIDSGGRSEGGFRIRIPSGVSVAKSDSRFYPKFSDERRNTDFGYGGKGLKEGSVSGLGKREREREKERDPVEEMVNAMKVLADGFMRTEQMKMEMVKEIESMRMEMEMKRTEMILESQHRIVEAFANAVSEQQQTKKKNKRVPSSPES